MLALLLQPMQAQPGRVVTVAGGRTTGDQDGVGTNAKFGAGGLVALNESGTTEEWLYVADRLNYKIRKVGMHELKSKGEVEVNTFYNFEQGDIGQLALWPKDKRKLFFAYKSHHEIKYIDENANVQDYAGSTSQSGELDGSIEEALFFQPSAISFNQRGSKLYVGEWGGKRIRVIDMELQTPTVTTIAGQFQVEGDADGVGTNALFKSIESVLFFGDKLYIADDNKIRYMTVDDYKRPRRTSVWLLAEEDQKVKMVSVSKPALIVPLESPCPVMEGNYMFRIRLPSERYVWV
ncbi:hypothetical protein AB1Y20_020786 [Prymnesium parvum]|uniref:SMP-30/Gluconolactonase/LRE-like region domain-containing protein n=1 Tax=Prymnesium parvum TaxID=97485 RepID=A0AB34JVM1_PRYPA